jgi:GMP synthase (glutamine-hydrolysing)
MGGLVLASNIREYGRANLDYICNKSSIFDDISEGSQVWMSHGDTIKKLPNNSTLLASTSDVENAAFRINGKDIYGLQFHPEVYHSKDGKKILENFLLNISKLKQDWTPDSFIDQTISFLKSELKSDKVILGLSGGVDSTVAAVLLNKAIGENLHCIFVNNGLLRKNEFEAVLDQYKDMNLNVKGVDYSSKFYKELKGVTDPELKRKSIGKVFIDAFDSESKKIKDVKWLAQGTIYPDVIESISATGGPSATIKSHHNVGGLPSYMKLKVVEPLKLLFKDEVRRVGTFLKIDSKI